MTYVVANDSCGGVAKVIYQSEEKISLNKAALKLLAKEAGLKVDICRRDRQGPLSAEDDSWQEQKYFEVFDAEELIAVITQHIPEKSFQLVRNYGLYSNRSRGKRRKATDQFDNLDPIPVTEKIELLDVSTYKSRREPSKTWREYIKNRWEVDPLEGRKWGSAMKIISFITKAQSEVIERILRHLHLWEDSPPKGRGPPASSSAKKHHITYEPFDDIWPGVFPSCRCRMG
jgi:hypothetical protein